jgi:hypothetical protein
MRLVRPLAAFLLIGTAAAAQPAPYPDAPPPQGQYGQPPGPPGEPPSGGARNRGIEKFNAANVTHDGRLTREQAQSGGLHGVARNFDAIDREHKGYVTIQDIRDWRRARKAANSAPQSPPPQSPPPPPQ